MEIEDWFRCLKCQHSTLLYILVLRCLTVLGQYTTNTCDWTIWDTVESAEVRNVVTKCSQGHIQWRNPYGAVRITFHLKDQTHNLRTCFKANSYFSLAKVSLENPTTTHPKDILKPLVVFNGTHMSMTREICIDTENEPLTLYLQAQSDLNSRTIGHIDLEYDVHWPLSKYSVDSMDDCRPCLDEELLQGVCLSDYVIRGSIEHVQHMPEHGESEAHVRVTELIRQVRPLFKVKSSSEDNSGQTVKHMKNAAQHSSDLKTDLDLLKGTNSILGDLGVIVVPHKCGIRKGAGEFLFMGRVRLGRAILGCAPRLEQFEALWTAALAKGENLCLMK